MIKPRPFRALAGSLLLLTVFACGGSGGGPEVCDPWTATPPASISVAQDSNFVWSFVSGYPVTSATISAGSSAVPPGMTLTNLGSSAYRLNTTAETPLGTYNLKIKGSTTDDFVCADAAEENFVVVVENPA